jgi:hypothetical protein
MVIATLTTYVSYKLDINFYVDLTLISIAIIFPLVFTIRGSFRRREKALEHLSQFRSSLKTVHYFVMSNKELTEENKIEIYNILVEISTRVMTHLRTVDNKTKELDDVINNVYKFISEKEGSFKGRIRDKVFRFMNDLHESIENLHAIHIHRTPISLKAYCKIFIYIFPLIYAPTIINNVGTETPQWVAYSIILLTEYILISLYNIQDQLEYPFDDKGLDDIKLENFKLDR